MIATAARSSIDVARQVGARLTRALHPGGGLEARLIRRRQFRWSEHLLFEIRGNGRGAEHVLVKRVKVRDRRGRTQSPAIDPGARSLAEHAALRTLHRIFARSSSDGLMAVRPCGCFPELDAVAMDYLPGRHLLSLIARAARPVAGARAGARATVGAHDAGRWLGILHRSLAGGQGCEAVEGGSYARRYAAEVRSLARALPDPAAAMIQRASRGLETGIGRQARIRILPLHGDFYPDNVVLSRSGLYAVDTTLWMRGPAEDDLARFLVGVDTLKLRVVAGAALVRSAPIERIQRAFLTGYRTVSEVIPELLVPAVVRACLVRWSELRSVAEIRLPAPIPALLRRRIDGFMTARLERALAGPRPEGSAR